MTLFVGKMWSSLQMYLIKFQKTFDAQYANSQQILLCFVPTYFFFFDALLRLLVILKCCLDDSFKIILL